MSLESTTRRFCATRDAGKRLALFLLAIWLGWPPPGARAAAHDDSEPLTVAVYDLAPYGSVNADGTFSGASVDLWRRVAETAGLQYNFVAVPQMETLLAGVRDGRFDVAIGAITITSERAAQLDFSYPAHRSGVAVALVKDNGAVAALRAYSLVVLQLSSIIGATLALLVLIGVVMWWIERPRDPTDAMEKSSVMTFRDGVYWAVVTMTTVGYGDKTPKTPTGRLVAILWMLASVALVSLLSASLVSRLTAEHMESRAPFKESELVGERLAAAAFSSGAEYLDDAHLQYTKYGSLGEALAALAEGREDVVVNSVGALRYLVAARFWRTLRVPPSLLAPAYMAFALPLRSPYKRPIDRALIKITGSAEWRAVEESYFAR
jgi:polar amino acid transport system substrate-binding protein